MIIISKDFYKFSELEDDIFWWNYLFPEEQIKNNADGPF